MENLPDQKFNILSVFAGVLFRKKKIKTASTQSYSGENPPPCVHRMFLLSPVVMQPVWLENGNLFAQLEAPEPRLVLMNSECK